MARFAPGLALMLIGLILADPRSAAGAGPPALGLLGNDWDGASAASQLDKVSDLAAEGKWPEVVDGFQEILRTQGDKLVAISPRRFIPVRQATHARIAALPEAALKRYRGRVDPLARRWVEAGIANRNERLLRRVVDESFCSTPGRDALDALGDIAFEQGRFREAEHWYRMLAPPASLKDPVPKVGELQYPDPSGDKALPRAKQLLACLFAGEAERFAGELTAFRAAHPTAEGRLAGVQGKYADILRDQATHHRALPPGGPPESWSTFGGDASRNMSAPGRPRDRNWLSRLAEAEPLHFDLAGRRLVDRDPDLDREAALAAGLPRLPTTFPAIVGHYVFVPNGQGVTVIDATLGASSTWLLDPDDRGTGASADAGDEILTLTVDHGRVYACVGGPKGWLVCLQVEAGPTGPKLQPRWKMKPPATGEKPGGGRPWMFAGSPLVSRGRAFLGLAQATTAGTRLAMACYDADEGTLLWHQGGLEPAVSDSGSPRNARPLLTLAGSSIVVATHTGFLAAADVDTGRPVWAMRYASRGRATPAGEASPRDLAPCVYADGRLYAAPADLDRVLCLDPETGSTLWEREGIEVAHLLGVGSKRLILTTPDGIRAISAATGGDEEGWLIPGDGSRLPSAGRGLLAADLVFWPTRDLSWPPTERLYVLGQADGRIADQIVIPTRLTAARMGNLALGDGVLAVAGKRGVSVYTAPRLRRSALRKDLEKRPESPSAHLLLAYAEADAGALIEADRLYQRAESLAGKGPSQTDNEWADRARQGRRHVLLEAASQARKRGQPREALSLLDTAATLPGSAQQRVEVLFARAEAAEEVGPPEQAVAAWQALLAEPAWRQQRQRDDVGAWQPVSQLAIGRIARIIADHGVAAYERAERQARSLLEGPGPASVDSLRRVVGAFPNAVCMPAALKKLADHLAATADYGQAVECYRRLRARPDCPPTEQSEALVGEARAYEALGCRRAALDAYRRLDNDFRNQKLANGSSVRDVTGPALRRLETESKAEDQNAAGPVLLARRWSADLALGERLLIPEPSPIGSTSSDRFFADDNNLLCRSSRSGEVRWRVAFPGRVTWLSCQDDLIAVGGPQAVQARSIDGGRLVWEYRGPADGGQSFQSFRRVGRCVVTQCTDQLVGLDLLDGRVRWQHPARTPGADFRAPVVGNQGILIAPLTNGRFELLNPGTGQWIATVGEFSGGHAGDAMPWEGNRFLLPLDGRRIACVDGDKGAILWTHTLEAPSSLRGEPPVMVAGGHALLVVVRRNYGDSMLRLDPETGKALWSRELPISTSPLEPASMAIGGPGLYVAAGGRLTARALDDGHLLWERSLPRPDGCWQLRVWNDQTLTCWQAAPPQSHWTVRLPWCSLECGECDYACDRSVESFPLLVLDPRNGRLDERFNFEPAGASTTLAIGAGSFLVIPGLMIRSRCSTGCNVLPAGDGWTVSSAGKAWGLSVLAARDPDLLP